MKHIRPNVYRASVLCSAVLFLLFCIFSLVIKPAQAIAGGVCDTVTMETLKKHSPIPQSEIVSKKEVMGMCEIVLKIGSEFVPVYATDKFVLAGELFTNKEQKTRETISKLEAVSVEQTKKDFVNYKTKLDQAAGIVYVPKGKIEHTVYMFGSTQCPWCSKAAKEIQPILDQTNTQLKILFSGSGAARTQAIEAVCKNVDLATYNSHKWESKEALPENSLCKEGVKKVTDSSDLAVKLGVKGVPVFFLDDGSQVVGANMDELKKRLSKTN